VFVVDRPTDLYRHFDENGNLLYVGISLSAVARLVQHRGRSGWFPRIARVEIERHSSRHEALEAERNAITQERPMFNVFMNEAGGYRVKRQNIFLPNGVPANERVKLVRYHPCMPICYCDDGVEDAPEGEDFDDYLCAAQLVFGFIGKSSITIRGLCDYCGSEFGWRDLAKTGSLIFTDLGGECRRLRKWPYLPNGDQITDGALFSVGHSSVKVGRLSDFVFLPDLHGYSAEDGHGWTFKQDDVASYEQWIREVGFWGLDLPRFMENQQELKAEGVECS
jgi:hypothetical protein